MKPAATVSLFLLCAVGLGGAGVSVRMADVVELSDGTVSRVSSHRSITGSGKSTGSDLTVFVEDQEGRRVGMKTSSDAEGMVTAVFWSPSGKDRVEVVVQLGFGDDNLAVPHVVTINGNRFRALIPKSDAIAYEAFAERMRSESEKELSPGFRAALRAVGPGRGRLSRHGNGMDRRRVRLPLAPEGSVDRQ